MIVDYHAHWYPPSYFESIEGRDRYPRAQRSDGSAWVFEFDDEELGSRWEFAERFTDLAVNVENMDANGVDVTVLSPTVPADVTGLELAEARETVEALNEEIARAQRERPDRIRGLAMLPLQDAAASVEVLDTAISELGLVGVCINTNVAGSSIAGPDLLPVYRRIEELDVPIFLHPSNRSTVFEGVKRSGGGRMTELAMAWVYDTSLAAMSLIYSGTLDDCPGLRVVHPHTGGVIPYLIGRIRVADEFHRKELGRDRSASEYFRANFYVDPASGSSAEMLALAIQTYGASHILWGSDYPFVDRAATVALLESLDDELAEQIASNRLAGLEGVSA